MAVLPGVCENVSQIDGPRPSSLAAPSIWYADAAKPHVKPGGKRWASASGLVSCSISVIAPKDRGAQQRPEGRLRRQNQARGRLSVNVAPPPSVAEWTSEPPCAVAIDAAIARPNPEPPRSRVRPVSAR